MKMSLSQRLYNQPSSLLWLMLAAIILLFGMLGARELWTQEWRWADISWNMLQNKDYLHPYLANKPYYDKPLLSYWLMLLTAKLFGGLTTWALRLPAALSGLLTLYCTYVIGTKIADRKTGLVAAWLLLTTYFFVFWARAATADMLNVAGIMLAVYWYMQRRDQNSFISYSGFFLILAVTALCKGLIGVVIALLAILPDLVLQKRWRQHLRWQLIVALLPALIIYFLPFWLSAHIDNTNYQADGLHEVFFENIVRFFAPFDHQGSVFTYVIYLPLYLLPWTLFFLPACFSLRQYWRELSDLQHRIVWAILLIFIFLTLSGSRRSYYILPIIPFAILFTAQWLTRAGEQAKRLLWSARLVVISYGMLFVIFIVALPIYYYNGLNYFAAQVRHQATALQPWQNWRVIILDGEDKLSFYLDPKHPPIMLDAILTDYSRHVATPAQLVWQWPLLQQKTNNRIIITRQEYVARLQALLPGYLLVAAEPSLGEHLSHTPTNERPVAFIAKP